MIVRNEGSTAMTKVSIHVTGESYSIGDLRPSESASVRVNPSGESHVEISYTDNQEVQRRLVADCYFEGGSLYHGKVDITVGDNEIRRVVSNIRVGPL